MDNKYQVNDISSGYGQRKVCNRCGAEKSLDHFPKTKNFFFPLGTLDTCKECINEHLELHKWNWEIVNRFCQMADVPFVPEQWESMKAIGQDEAFYAYCDFFMAEEYDNLDWMDYYLEFKNLQENGLIEKELPQIRDARIRRLKAIFGGDVDPENLDYLENLLNGFKTTRNVNGVIDTNHAVKLCRLSLNIDSKIREGEDCDKDIRAYELLTRIAGFAAKDAKNINDFDSVGELFSWYEKRGWKNEFHDGVTRDIVDGTMKSIQNFSQKLYTNESGIGEHIDERAKQLQMIKEMEEDAFGEFDYNLEKYDDETYDELMNEPQEFVADLDNE